MARADKVPAIAPTERPAEHEIRAGIVENFSRIARVAENGEHLRLALGNAVRALGFDHFCLQGEGAAVLLADLPPGCTFPSNPESDLVWKAAALSLAPFQWSDIPRLLPLNTEGVQFIAAAPPVFSVPIHRSRMAVAPGIASAGSFVGCCSFVVRRGAPLPTESFAAAHYVGTLAFDAAHRLGRAQPARPRLTPRQHDCMVLAAQGKSDWEIGKLLGISESTVHKHIEDAKRRFGVSTRIQVVVRSLADARLSFADILGADS